MAPNRGSSSKGKPSATKGKSSTTLSSASRVSKSSAKAKKAKRPVVAKEVKSKSRSAPDQLKKTKKRQYTEEELDLPKLNMITPVGVTKPKGKKKGKTFIDDQESMMTILAMVNAEKEGQIESKMMRARQLEEIREAKRKEAEARQQQKKSKLENIKEELRNKKKKKKRDHENNNAPDQSQKSEDAENNKPKKRKSVAFA
ncbi:hypothetical protein VTN77DRAFT_7156 [Rasamsonia byssochlamydoides]|uniref:uncharacterized protein n=1 Tax=Rasamsonia byssochlamydoides TaxID=89139 RepID=UPI00374201A1